MSTSSSPSTSSEPLVRPGQGEVHHAVADAQRRGGRRDVHATTSSPPVSPPAGAGCGRPGRTTCRRRRCGPLGLFARGVLAAPRLAALRAALLPALRRGRLHGARAARRAPPRASRCGPRARLNSRAGRHVHALQGAGRRLVELLLPPHRPFHGLHEVAVRHELARELGEDLSPRAFSRSNIPFSVTSSIDLLPHRGRKCFRSDARGERACRNSRAPIAAAWRPVSNSRASIASSQSRSRRATSSRRAPCRTPARTCCGGRACGRRRGVGPADGQAEDPHVVPHVVDGLSPLPVHAEDRPQLRERRSRASARSSRGAPPSRGAG